VVFLACVHLALFLALSISPGKVTRLISIKWYLVSWLVTDMSWQISVSEKNASTSLLVDCYCCVMQDLRGMLPDADCRAESWYELISVLHRLVTVTSLHVGSCPASVVHAVADQMFWLRHFSAENVAYRDRFCFFIALYTMLPSGL